MDHTAGEAEQMQDNVLADEGAKAGRLEALWSELSSGVALNSLWGAATPSQKSEISFRETQMHPPTCLWQPKKKNKIKNAKIVTLGCDV